MSAKPKKRIVPNLVSESLLPANNAFEAAAKKKNPLENTADLIAMRYGISGDAPQINEAVFAKNRAIGKKVVPLKEYFEQTAKDFKEKEALQKEEAAQNAKLSPCQRKLNTLQRNIDGYIQACDPALSNKAVIEMLDQARTKAQTKARTRPQKKSRKNTNSFKRASSSKKGGRKKTKCIYEFMK
jgi:hypothetical protein